MRPPTSPDAVPVSVVKHIANHVRAAVLTRYRSDSCIASTAVFIDVAEWLGLDASPAAVDVLAANPAALDVLGLDPVPPVADWPRGAWTVGVDSRQPAREGGWPGHLVAVLHGDRDRLVDVSAGQFHRPERDLRVPSPALGRLPEGWGPGTACVTHLHGDGTMLRWTVTGDQSWRASPNWDPDGDERQRQSRDAALATAKAFLTREEITPSTFSASMEDR